MRLCLRRGGEVKVETDKGMLRGEHDILQAKQA